MDNVTHTLTGLMLARAFRLDKESAIPRGALLLMLAANAPDIDIVSGLFGAATYLDRHRWVTHGIVVAPLLAFLPMLIVRAMSRDRAFPWARAWRLSVIAIFSHLALDWTNVYGIRLLAPFSQQWFRLDITHVVDPWILAALLLALVAPWLARLVGSEIGGNRSASGPQQGWAFFALTFLLLYDGSRFIAHARAMAQLSARMYAQALPDRVTALPHGFNLLRWTGVVEQPKSVVMAPVDAMAEFDPAAGRTYYRPGPEWAWAIQAAQSHPDFQAFGRFAQLPFWKVTILPEPEGAVRVTLLDLRFGSPAEPGFAASGLVRKGVPLEQVTLSFGSVTRAFR